MNAWSGIAGGLFVHMTQNRGPYPQAVIDAVLTLALASAAAVIDCCVLQNQCALKFPSLGDGIWDRCAVWTDKVYHVPSSFSCAQKSLQAVCAMAMAATSMVTSSGAEEWGALCPNLSSPVGTAPPPPPPPLPPPPPPPLLTTNPVVTTACLHSLQQVLPTP